MLILTQTGRDACRTVGWDEGRITGTGFSIDVLAGPLLAEKARERGTVYSMAYGDQPALVAEMVDWARAAGFTVAAAGKGTKYLPHDHAVTPDDVWTHYGLTAERSCSCAHQAGENEIR